MRTYSPLQVKGIVDRACSMIEINPRALGYITKEQTLKNIQNLKKFEIWQVLHTDEIIQQFPRIQDTFGINFRSLRHWHNHLKLDREWLPLHKKDPDKSNVFTTAQLENLAKIILRIANSQNVIITNQLVKNLSLAYYKSLAYHPQPHLNFSASSHFISNFKKAFRFSTRRLHPKRRPTANKQTVDIFLRKAKRIFRKAQPDHIVNADESFWRCEEYHNKTWALTNSSSILLHTTVSEKS